MRSRIERVARLWWAGGLPKTGWLLHALLTPVSWLWRAVTRMRNAHWDRIGGERVPGVTVVSVGNLAVGGTGKTPVASWVADTCARGGASVALVLSGYGEDEVLLHRRWTPQVPVVAGSDRVGGAREAARDGADVVVVDDGFQHRRLARDVDLVLLAAEDGAPTRTMPLGPFREGLGALGRADGVIITRRTAGQEASRSLADLATRSHPSLVVGGVRLAGGRWTDLEGDPTEAPAGDVLAVAAIGRPEGFRETVRGLLGTTVELMPFGDHHDFSGEDVLRLRKRAGERPIVVTEKDAVKLAARGADLGEAYVLAQTLEWEWGRDEIETLLGTALRPGAA